MQGRSWTESERLAALDRYKVLDSKSEQSIDDVVRLTAELLEAPIAAVNLIARDRQWFKSEIGLGVREMPLDDSICKHALFESDRMVVQDTLLDSRFNCNPLVTGGPGLRFYAGELLKTPEGLPLGTLCVLDTKARPEGLTSRQEFALQTLARQIMTQLELRKLAFEQDALLRENLRASEELRRERDRAQQLLRGMDEGFVYLDRSFRIRELSPGSLRMDGRSEQELLGLTHWEAWPGSEDLPVADSIRRAMACAQPAALEQLYVFPSGRNVWLDVRIFPAEDGVAMFYRDITERKDADRKLREADQRKDEFLAMLAHELRNPLAPITSAAHLLTSDRLDPKRAPTIAAIISRQARHMTALVDDLLDVSRVTRGLITLESKPVDAKAVIASAVEQARPSLEKHKHELSLHLSPEPSIVNGDRERLVQIVANLVNNAAKYTPDGGVIQVALEVHADLLTITVKDSGIGMSEELIGRAFELFTQAERTPDRRQGGLGIGLALVRSLATLHGGDVVAHSGGAGKGSTFTVSLPRHVLAAGGDRAVPAGAGHQRITAPLRIAIVDDNEDAATTLAAYLEAYGHEVCASTSARNAIERAKSFRPDIAILDIGMPEMDGFELARQLRSMPETSHSMLVALTGYGQDRDRKEALAAGFDHHLVKPVDLEVLQRLIQEISRYRQQPEGQSSSGTPTFAPAAAKDEL